MTRATAVALCCIKLTPRSWTNYCVPAIRRLLRHEGDSYGGSACSVSSTRALHLLRKAVSHSSPDCLHLFRNKFPSFLSTRRSKEHPYADAKTRARDKTHCIAHCVVRFDADRFSCPTSYVADLISHPIA